MTILRQGLAAILLSSAVPAFAQPVSIADPGYASAQASAYVVKALLEDQIGTLTEIVASSSVPVIWEALNRNSGEIDIWTDVWLPNQSGLVEQYTGAGKNVNLTANSYAGTQKYCTLTATAEKHDIRSVFDLTDPEKAKLFAPVGGDRGQIWVGAAGWLSTNFEEIRARNYGFAPFFDLLRSDEAVATAGLDAAAKSGGAWIGYCYAPNQNYARYDLTDLEEPPHDPATWVVADQSAPDWAAKSKIGSAYKDAAIHIAYTDRFAAESPEGVRIVESIAFTTRDINELAYAIAVEGTAPDQAARDWIAANGERVAGWLAGK